ncbi:unnamed protein product [Caenorhabditis brenneri]
MDWIETILLVLLRIVVAQNNKIDYNFYYTQMSPPRLECGSEGIRLHISPTGTFGGHVYVRGFFPQTVCHLNFCTRLTNQPIIMDLPFRGPCNVRRRRNVAPPSISYDVTVIIQHHPLFITSFDKAYRLNCIYRQQESVLQQRINVSDIPSTSLQSKNAPKCRYDVLSGSLNGPIVKFANVGDIVVHKWTCDSDRFGFVVHSCVVRDESGKDFQFIDERGTGGGVCVPDNRSYAQKIVGYDVESANTGTTDAIVPKMIFAYSAPDLTHKIETVGKSDTQSENTVITYTITLVFAYLTSQFTSRILRANSELSYDAESANTVITEAISLGVVFAYSTSGFTLKIRIVVGSDASSANTTATYSIVPEMVFAYSSSYLTRKIGIAVKSDVDSVNTITSDARIAFSTTTYRTTTANEDRDRDRSKVVQREENNSSPTASSKYGTQNGYDFPNLESGEGYSQDNSVNLNSGTRKTTPDAGVDEYGLEIAQEKLKKSNKIPRIPLVAEPEKLPKREIFHVETISKTMENTELDPLPYPTKASVYQHRSPRSHKGTDDFNITLEVETPKMLILENEPQEEKLKMEKNGEKCPETKSEGQEQGLVSNTLLLTTLGVMQVISILALITQRF